jgi:hypothetical protein
MAQQEILHDSVKELKQTKTSFEKLTSRQLEEWARKNVPAFESQVKAARTKKDKVLKCLDIQKAANISRKALRATIRVTESRICCGRLPTPWFGSICRNGS